MSRFLVHRRLRVLGLLVGLLLAAVGCGSSGGGGSTSGGGGDEAAGTSQGISDNEVVLGVNTCLSGPLAATCAPERDGLEIWADEVNANGGINGRKVRLVFVDDQGDPQKTLAAVRRLVTQDKVFALLAGTVSSGQIPAMKYLDSVGIPFVASVSSNAKLIEPGNKNVYRVYGNEVAQGQAIADYLVKVAKVKRPAIIYNSSDYGQGGMATTKEALEALGVHYVAEETYNPGDTDFRTQLLRIKKANADAVVAYSYPPEGIPVLQQAKTLGLDVPFIGGGAMAVPEIPEATGDAGVGFVTSYPVPYYVGDTKNDVVAAYDKKLAAKHGGSLPSQRPSIYDFLGYAAGKVFEQGLKGAGDNPTWGSLEASLDKLKDYSADGVLFPVTYSPTKHEGTTEVSFLQIGPDHKWSYLPPAK